jgi:V8-like Glu-specific endopeptidase
VSAPRRLHAAAAALFVVAAGLVAGGAFVSGPASANPAPNPTVGAVYLSSVAGLQPALHLPHVCTASVVHSPGRNLILAAAHCVAGTGLGIEFAPGYHLGQTPFGVWDVQRAWVDPAWTASQDPRHDYAFLQVAHKTRNGHLVGIEDVVGANVLGSAPAAGSTVTVSGYVVGTGDDPVTCTTTVYYTGVYPSFDCAGFADGTSGGPWLQNGQVVGLIGGLHQGGCTPSTSYSSPFDASTLATFQRAVSGTHPDFVQPAGSDGC